MKPIDAEVCSPSTTVYERHFPGNPGGGFVVIEISNVSNFRRTKESTIIFLSRNCFYRLRPRKGSVVMTLIVPRNNIVITCPNDALITHFVADIIDEKVSEDLVNLRNADHAFQGNYLLYYFFLLYRT